ncbi:hypothetical protein FNV43_RR05027 [Rhamnella rubrinervis]|uniref:Uncharacterized protein n=1 Tax=Rhamnella rubrinervis TaxID=2594499 RepID=A0A8K0MQP4_9ROSA|nr:hypothetical protein FNV43_RR05027 [Rhamnella rubrinervis]
MERIERYRSDESGRNPEILVTTRVKEKKAVRSGRRNSWCNAHPAAPNQRKEHKTVNVMKRSKTTSSKVSIKSWWNDPEMKRKRRVASYKYYGAQGNLKKSFRWFKTKCTIFPEKKNLQRSQSVHPVELDPLTSWFLEKLRTIWEFGSQSPIPNPIVGNIDPISPVQLVTRLTLVRELLLLGFIPQTYVTDRWLLYETKRVPSVLSSATEIRSSVASFVNLDMEVGISPLRLRGAGPSVPLRWDMTRNYRGREVKIRGNLAQVEVEGKVEHLKMKQAENAAVRTQRSMRPAEV